jgi:hypothetical protein
MRFFLLCGVTGATFWLMMGPGWLAIRDPWYLGRSSVIVLELWLLHIQQYYIFPDPVRKKRFLRNLPELFPEFVILTSHRIIWQSWHPTTTPLVELPLRYVALDPHQLRINLSGVTRCILLFHRVLRHYDVVIECGDVRIMGPSLPNSVLFQEFLPILQKIVPCQEILPLSSEESLPPATEGDLFPIDFRRLPKKTRVFEVSWSVVTPNPYVHGCFVPDPAVRGALETLFTVCTRADRDGLDVRIEQGEPVALTIDSLSNIRECLEDDRVRQAFMILTGLRSVAIRGGKLTALPPWMGIWAAACPKLTELDLSGNNFTDVVWQAACFPQLRTLYVHWVNRHRVRTIVNDRYPENHQLGRWIRQIHEWHHLARQSHFPVKNLDEYLLAARQAVDSWTPDQVVTRLQQGESLLPLDWGHPQLPRWISYFEDELRNLRTDPAQEYLTYLTSLNQIAHPGGFLLIL